MPTAGNATLLDNELAVFKYDLLCLSDANQ